MNIFVLLILVILPVYEVSVESLYFLMPNTISYRPRKEILKSINI